MQGKLVKALRQRANSKGLGTALEPYLEQAAEKHPRFLVREQWNWPTSSRLSRAKLSRFLGNKIHHEPLDELRSGISKEYGELSLQPLAFIPLSSSWPCDLVCGC